MQGLISRTAGTGAGRENRRGRGNDGLVDPEMSACGAAHMRVPVCCVWKMMSYPCRLVKMVYALTSDARHVINWAGTSHHNTPYGTRAVSDPRLRQGQCVQHRGHEQQAGEMAAICAASALCSPKHETTLGHIIASNC